MGDYPTINSTRTDADSVPDEDLFDDLRLRGDYLFESQLRCGEDADTSRVRLAYARGRTAFTDPTAAGGTIVVSGTIAYSTATDGDPNFSGVPAVIVSLESDDSGGSNEWDQGADEILVTVHVDYGTITTSQFDYVVKGINLDGAEDFDGFIHWQAIGPVTSGE